ncbi:MAG: protein kinase, partial [Eubacteriales bacterium]
MSMESYDRYVGQVFDGRYRILKTIGVGGMAVVFEAYDLFQKKTVAVKMLKDESASDVQQVRRFLNESKAVAMLSHPNIVKIYNISVKGKIKFIVMEYIEGITLKEYMTKRGVLSLGEIISYTEQILHALEHAHAKGIVHRDIKPQNIMLLKNGVIKVTDFGIAKLPNAETLTVTDKAIGTVFYISPEQAEGNGIDRRSDLYSLGVMMYEMSCGRLPFYDESPISVALMQIKNTPVPPRTINPSIPRGLEQIILSAMEKDPALRFQSATQMLRQLARLKADPNIVFRPNPK